MMFNLKDFYVEGHADLSESVIVVVKPSETKIVRLALTPDGTAPLIN